MAAADIRFAVAPRMDSRRPESDRASCQLCRQYQIAFPKGRGRALAPRSYTPVLHQQIVRKTAIPTLEPRPQGRIVFGPTPTLTIPVIGCAADALARNERFQAPCWQCRFA